MEQNLNETINISKNEYASMKEVYDKYCKLYNNDFFLKIKKGLILPKEHPDYYNGRIDIEIYNENTYSIQIEGKTYSINNNIFNEVKKVVEQYIEKLIYYSKIETKQFLLENSLEGGSPGSIFVKYGQLMINLNGQVFGEVGNLCSEIIDKIISLIINNTNLITNDISAKEKIQDSNYNDKFVWKEGEIKIAKTQCELCKYNNVSTPNKCEVYPNGKPQEVISNTNKCNYLDTQNDIL